MKTFNYDGQYTCECGKQFNNSQSFNGHRCHCRVHLGEARYNKQQEHQLRLVAMGSVARSEKAANVRSSALAQWIAEQHTCEKCGKVMTEKFASGRFCSRSCANGIHTGEHILSEKGLANIAAANKLIHRGNCTNAKEYSLNPRHCPICSGIIPYEKRMNKTCSKQCGLEYQRRTQLSLVKAGLHKGWLRRPLLSYAEQFWKKVLENNSIPAIHDYPVAVDKTHYLLDFFIEPNIDIEIDGSQHLLPESIAHDTIRDKRLKQQGYLIYRIPYINPKDKEAVKQQVDDFISWFNSLDKPQ